MALWEGYDRVNTSKECAWEGAGEAKYEEWVSGGTDA